MLKVIVMFKKWVGGGGGRGGLWRQGVATNLRGGGVGWVGDGITQLQM